MGEPHGCTKPSIVVEDHPTTMPSSLPQSGPTTGQPGSAVGGSEPEGGGARDEALAGRPAPTTSRGTIPGSLLWTIGALSATLVLAEAMVLTRYDQVDIRVYLAGASRLFSGTLYTGRTPGSGLFFTYPPISAFFFAPLSLVPLGVAEAVWALVNVASLWLLLAVSLKAARPSLARRAVVQWSLILMGPAFVLDPVRLTFAYGQINLLLAAAILVDLTATVRIGSRTLPRGVLTGLAAALKLTPLIFVPFLLLTRQTRAAVTATVTFVACGALMSALAPGESWAFWTRYLGSTERIGRTFSWNNQSVASVLYRFHHRPVPTGVVVVVEVVIGVAGIALAVWAYRVSSPFLGILVCAVTGLMVSPITWTHHIVWVVPVLAWMVLAEDRPRWGAVWALLGFAVFWWAPNWHQWARGTTPLQEHGLQLIGGSGLFAAMLAFQGGIALMLLYRGQARAGDASTPVVVGSATGGPGGRGAGRGTPTGPPPSGPSPAGAVSTRPGPLRGRTGAGRTGAATPSRTRCW